MHRPFRRTTSLTKAVRFAAVFIICALSLRAQPALRPAELGQTSSEEKTAQRFESLRKTPPQLLAFLLQMPKGADLHNHLSGAVYAESYIQWAAEAGLCVNVKTMILASPSGTGCTGDLQPATMALKNSVLYRQMIDAWSMRNWELSDQSGHDHFFDAFAKFGAATYNKAGRMLAEVASRAAQGHVLYLELMLTVDGVPSFQLAQSVGWDGNSESTLQKLKSNGLEQAVSAAAQNLRSIEAEKDQLLKCGTAQADPGCEVTIRYISQVGRAASPGTVFTLMVTGFTLASDPNSKVVAVNLVQPEDGLASMQNFSLQMQMLSFLRPLYPRAHLTLHAGELVEGMVPPEGLTFHVRDSVMIAKAERIGHGVDIMHESEPIELLKEMARRNVMVEICLSSNDLILGIKGARHPLATYIQNDVPVALATDDEGVSRSELSREFLKAAEEQGLGYVQLKMMARNSLQYAFVSGGSLWSDGRRFTSVSQCSQDLATMQLTSTNCREFLAGNEKARLQWKLEEEFNAFEQKF